MDERRQLDFAQSERRIMRFVDLRPLGLGRNKDIDVVPRPEGATISPIRWNGTVK